jgi:hypothetical protein
MQCSCSSLLQLPSLLLLPLLRLLSLPQQLHQLLLQPLAAHEAGCLHCARF